MEQKITIPEGFELKRINASEYVVVKKEKELPNSWEEFCNTHPIRTKERYITRNSTFEGFNYQSGRLWKENGNFLPNEEYAEAILALCQLIQLRDCYRQGWKPKWENDDMKLTVEQQYNDMVCSAATHVAKIFSFQSEEIRNKFYKNFKKLIDKTKPLFM